MLKGDAERYDVKYAIRPANDTLRAEVVALGYKKLVDVDNVIHTLKKNLNFDVSPF